MQVVHPKYMLRTRREVCSPCCFLLLKMKARWTISYTNESRISVSVSLLEAERLIKMKVLLTHHVIKCASHKLCLTSMFVLIGFSFCADGSGGIT